MLIQSQSPPNLFDHRRGTRRTVRQALVKGASWRTAKSRGQKNRQSKKAVQQFIKNFDKKKATTNTGQSSDSRPIIQRRLPPNMQQNTPTRLAPGDDMFVW